MNHVGAPNRKPLSRKFTWVICDNRYVYKESTLVHIGTKHEGWDYPRALKEWKTLAKNKLELWHRKDIGEEENKLLREVLDKKMKSTGPACWM